MPTSTRPRDSQRSKVYAAEAAVPHSPLPGLDACERFADRVVGTFWWQLRFPDRALDTVPRVRPGNGARQAFLRDEDDGSYTMTLPRRYRTKGVVLHELTHWALRGLTHVPDHGRTFTRVLLDATAEFCGPERAGLLLDAFRARAVHVGPAPQPDFDGLLHYGWDETAPPLDSRR